VTRGLGSAASRSARVVLVLLAVVSTALLAWSTPLAYDARMRTCLSPGRCPWEQLTPSEIAGLDRLGLGQSGYALLELSLVLLLAGTCLAVALLLLRLSGRSEALYAAGALTALAVAFPQTLPSLVAGSTPGALAVSAVELVAGAAFMAWLLTFPDGRFDPPWTVALVGALATGQVAGWLDLVPPGWVSTALTVVTLAVVVSVLARRLARFDHEARVQLRFVAAAFTAALTALVVAEVAQGAAGVRPGTVADLVVQCGLTLAFLTVPVSVAAATLRRGLYDVNASIGRATTYAFLAVGALTLQVLLVSATSWLAVDGTGASLVSAALVAVAVLPAYRWLRRVTNRALYGLRDEPRELVSRLIGGVTAGATPGATLENTVTALGRALRLPYAAVLVAPEGVVRPAGPPPPDLPVEELPLVHEDKQVGVLRLAARDPGGRLTERDLSAVAPVLGHLAALAHADDLALRLQLSHQELVAAREEERRRIRDDLHDDLGPMLGAVRLTLAAAGNHLHERPDLAAEHLATARTQLGAAVADIRRLVYGLRPPALDQLGLVGAIQAWTRGLPESAPPVEVVGPPSLCPGAAVEVAAYRIVLEAVTNVLRHADASCCRVRVAVQGDSLVLDVEDDGRGAHDLPWVPGVGLRSMRERAVELGGSLGVAAAATTGSRLTATLPLGGDHRATG
jgi:signal transduction histidine kinase